jgi:hypothetical protein
LNLVLDLYGQLAGRRQYQRTRGRSSGRPFAKEPLKNRDEKRGGLAGSRLRAGDHVVPDERQRNHAALDRTCLGPSEIADAVKQPRIEIQTVEGNRCRVERLGLVRQDWRLGFDVNRLVRTLAASGMIRASAAAPALRC